MTQPRRVLTLFDSTCLILGIIVGVGIYQVAPDVARGVDGPKALLGLWVIGGMLSLCGALCYAELAAAYPLAGGDYVYLTRAYGPLAGFLFGWAQLAIVRPGDIAVIAFAFATYACSLEDPLAGTGFLSLPQLYAVTAIAVLTIINVLGVRQGKTTQNLLTIVKIAGLLCVVAMAGFAKPAGPAEPVEAVPLSLALILVLFTYGGWNEMAYVAAEVRDPRRNVRRALLLGTIAVTVLYLIVNTAFLSALGFEGIRASTAVASNVVDAVFPGVGRGLIRVLICISALGAVNGMIFTGARISFAVGRGHRLFRPLGMWHADRGTPVAALIFQGGMACLLVLLLGSFLHAVLYTAAVVYAFYLATTVSLLVLRHREPDLERPYRVMGYPFTPLAFAVVCGFLVCSAVAYRPWVATASLVVLLSGIPVHWLSRAIERPLRGT